MLEDLGELELQSQHAAPDNYTSASPGLKRSFGDVDECVAGGSNDTHFSKVAAIDDDL